MNFMETEIRRLVGKVTEYNLRDWSEATPNQREIWKGMIDNWIEEIKKLESEEKEDTWNLADNQLSSITDNSGTKHHILQTCPFSLYCGEDITTFISKVKEDIERDIPHPHGNKTFFNVDYLLKEAIIKIIDKRAGGIK